MEWPEIGERIRESRLAAGLSQGELARAMHLDRTMIAKIETGRRRIDALELARLSHVLELPLDHFLAPWPRVFSRPAHSPDDGGRAAHRAPRLETTLFAWLQDVRQVRSSGRLRTAEPLVFPGKVTSAQDARGAAGWIRRQLKLGRDPIDSLMRVCQDAGQLVLVTATPGEGASLVEDGVAVAVVSNVADPGLRRATAARQLGRLVLGDEYSAAPEAGAFAAELLLPTATVAASLAGSPERAQLIKLAATYRTSWSVAIRQAAAIDQDLARRWRGAHPTKAELLEAVGRAPQPGLSSTFVPPNYARAVMRLWRDDLITSSRAVELLRGQISLAELRR